MVIDENEWLTDSSQVKLTIFFCRKNSIEKNESVIWWLSLSLWVAWWEYSLCIYFFLEM